MKKQTIATIAVLVIIVGLMGVVIKGGQSSNSVPKNPETEGGVLSESENSSEGKQEITPVRGEIVIYYGVSCSYCKDVDDWIEKNQAEEYLDIVQKEVYEDQDNAQELIQAAAACGRNTTRGVGVPFMYADDQCYSGKFEIINYLDQQLFLAQQQVEEQSDAQDTQVEEVLDE